MQQSVIVGCVGNYDVTSKKNANLAVSTNFFSNNSSSIQPLQLFFFSCCRCRYYKDIQALPGISDQDMAAMLAEHSHNHQYDFHTMTALNELYFYYACTYKVEVSWFSNLLKLYDNCSWSHVKFAYVNVPGSMFELSYFIQIKNPSGIIRTFLEFISDQKACLHLNFIPLRKWT